MQSILGKIDICKLGKIDKQYLPLWVYGTLRRGGQYHFYLVDCSVPVGRYQMRGTLMQMVSGDVFVRKSKAEGHMTAEQGEGAEQFTIGELYNVSLAGLWRIFHLENQSGSFPKAYDLDVSEIVDAGGREKKIALWFRRREEEPLPCQDYNAHKPLLEKLVEFIEDRGQKLTQNEIDKFLRKELKRKDA